MITFKKHPFRWVYTYVFWNNLPLLWKAKVAVWHMKVMQYRKHFKNELLGKKVVVITSVDLDWQVYQTVWGELPIRDITYRYKREKLPFAYFTRHKGSQCTDETAHPVIRAPHPTIVDSSNKVYELMKGLNTKLQRAAEHQMLRESIVEHQFQEYDHDYATKAPSDT